MALLFTIESKHFKKERHYYSDSIYSHVNSVRTVSAVQKCKPRQSTLYLNIWQILNQFSIINPITLDSQVTRFKFDLTTRYLSDVTSVGSRVADLCIVDNEFRKPIVNNVYTSVIVVDLSCIFFPYHITIRWHSPIASNFYFSTNRRV